MNWQDIETYIRVTAPEGFMAELKGVPHEHVQECELQLGILLPPMYVEFLLVMGAGSGDFYPFGGHFDHNFYLLLENLTFVKYPAQKYFRVAYQTNDVDVIEPCLDLGRAADGDTPLVEIPGDMAFVPEYVRDLGYSLAERLATRAFVHFGMNYQHGQTVSASFETPDQLALVQTRAIELLRRMQFGIDLSPSPFMTCMASPDMAALVEARLFDGQRTYLAIDVVGYDEKQVKRLAEILIDALPDFSDATLMAWPFYRG